jgi:hypothetical protein
LRQGIPYHKSHSEKRASSSVVLLVHEIYFGTVALTHPRDDIRNW